MFGYLSGWLLYSLKMSSKSDSLLVAMAIIVIIITIIFIIIVLLNFLKKKIAIYVNHDELVVVKYKERHIKFSSIKNIQYRNNTLNNKLTILKFNFGMIVITLSNDKIIKVD